MLICSKTVIDRNKIGCGSQNDVLHTIVRHLENESVNLETEDPTVFYTVILIA